jgi:hypothetical protein
LECGDSSPLFPPAATSGGNSNRRQESGDESPHSKADGLFTGLLVNAAMPSIDVAGKSRRIHLRSPCLASFRGIRTTYTWVILTKNPQRFLARQTQLVSYVFLVRKAGSRALKNLLTA